MASVVGFGDDKLSEKKLTPKKKKELTEIKDKESDDESSDDNSALGERFDQEIDSEVSYSELQTNVAQVFQWGTTKPIKIEESKEQESLTKIKEDNIPSVPQAPLNLKALPQKLLQFDSVKQAYVYQQKIGGQVQGLLDTNDYSSDSSAISPVGNIGTYQHPREPRFFKDFTSAKLAL